MERKQRARCVTLSEELVGSVKLIMKNVFLKVSLHYFRYFFLHCYVLYGINLFQSETKRATIINIEVV